MVGKYVHYVVRPQTRSKVQRCDVHKLNRNPIFFRPVEIPVCDYNDNTEAANMRR